MKALEKNRFIKVIIGIILVFLISSCHSEYLNIEIKTDGSVAWNKDSSAFAFIAKINLFRMPTGIARFPDGGKIKKEYLDFSLYHFDIKHKKLTRLVRLNEFYSVSSYRWLSLSQVKLNLHDSLLFYKLKKPYLKIDEKKHPDFMKDISRTYSINLFTHQKSIVDTTVYQHLFDGNQGKLRLATAKTYLSGLKYSDWGISLKELYPQTKETYSGYIVMKEGNDKMRQAIFEQIVPEFSMKEREKILKRMQKQKAVLFDDYNTLDAKKDPYRRSRRKEKYDDYITYMNKIEKKLFNR